MSSQRMHRPLCTVEGARCQCIAVGRDDKGRPACWTCAPAFAAPKPAPRPKPAPAARERCTITRDGCTKVATTTAPSRSGKTERPACQSCRAGVMESREREHFQEKK